MGLFHYLYIIKINNSIDSSKVENFFVNNKFVYMEKTDTYAELVYSTFYGDIEVQINSDKEVSIRTKVQNKVEIIDVIFSVLKQFAEMTGSNLIIYDFQYKLLLDLSNVQKLRELYLKRQDELKDFF